MEKYKNDEVINLLNLFIEQGYEVYWLNDIQEEKAKRWKEKHLNKHHNKKLDAVWSYKFSFNGIGLSVTVKCLCGKEKDITDYNEW